MIAEEIGAQRLPRGATASRRSRPISANTSSSCATSCPRHIIAPAVHLTKDAGRGRLPPRAHASAGRPRSRPSRRRCSPRRARVLREKFLAADVGITGANFLIAETGTSVIVTNEGNGDLTQTLPQVHIVLASDREAGADARGRGAAPARAGALGDRPGDVGLHHVLDRPAPRRTTPTGPSEYHVVLLDNGRSAHARHRVPGHAALHPLRRLHEPLPGLSRGRRPRLWLGLSRPDGRGADAAA